MPSELADFLPYLLNQAAELTSRDFQRHYKEKYGMLRTEWRVLFHLGQHGEMTAKQICAQASIHKTKVSRAVVALERKRLLKRETVENDRRFERLNLTKAGIAVFEDLSGKATEYDRSIARDFGQEDLEVLKSLLGRMITTRSSSALKV